MPYWVKYLIIVFVLLFAIRVFNQFLDYIKRKSVDEHENYKTIGRYFANNPKARRAHQIELLYRAREFFLKPGVIRRRSSPGTDEDDRG